MKNYYIPFIVLFSACENSQEIELSEFSVEKDSIAQENTISIEKTSLVILGTIQDGGSPHIGCEKECCKNLFDHPDHNRKVVSLGIIDPENKQNYIFEATPDFTFQNKNLQNYSNFSHQKTPDGIFITHAHIGHYSGLMYLGKEAMDADSVPVYAMPRMKEFLENNGPWSQLVNNKNISLHPILNSEEVKLNSNLSVRSLLVPHRDEYSETVGYIINGPSKKALFIPDIDKWDKWEVDIIQAISEVDYAFIDGTFYSGEEINSRDISEIPHPFISESMDLFKDLSAEEKNKIYFIHFNHTNPVLDPNSEATATVLANGFNIARINLVIEL